MTAPLKFGIGKVGVRGVQWSIRPELIPVSVA